MRINVVLIVGMVHTFLFMSRVRLGQITTPRQIGSPIINLVLLLLLKIIVVRDGKCLLMYNIRFITNPGSNALKLKWLNNILLYSGLNVRQAHTAQDL